MTDVPSETCAKQADRGRMDVPLIWRNYATPIGTRGARIASLLGGSWTTSNGVTEARMLLLEEARACLLLHKELEGAQ